MATDDSGRSPLGGVSLALGVTSIALVFGIGLCAVVGARQGWLRIAATPLYICGASSAFLGLIAVVLGLGGFFGRSSKPAAAAGLLLGGGGICLFFAVLRSISG